MVNNSQQNVSTGTGIGDGGADERNLSCGTQLNKDVQNGIQLSQQHARTTPCIEFN